MGTGAPRLKNLVNIAFFGSFFTPHGRHCLPIKRKFNMEGYVMGSLQVSGAIAMLPVLQQLLVVGYVF